MNHRRSYDPGVEDRPVNCQSYGERCRQCKWESCETYHKEMFGIDWRKNRWKRESFATEYLKRQPKWKIGREMRT